MNNFVFFIMGKKGLSCLEAVVLNNMSCLKEVVFATDYNVKNDYANDILSICLKNNIPCINKNDYNYEQLKHIDYFIAVSWRWLIHVDSNKLIVLHDSILPKYRGFNPLVSALINGDKEIGVTALFANQDFDRGDIIDCIKTQVTYPINIENAIQQISLCYKKLVLQIINKKFILASKQNEEEASYSLWRDEEDYYIDWNLDAETIERTVNALGFPYNGAKTNIGKQIIILEAVNAIADVKIVNRTPGKVLFIENKLPVIVCGTGLLKILKMKSCDNENFQIIKFRTRFK